MAKAKFRLVHTSFWNDPTVSEEMTPEDKYFFLYLLTNEHTTQIGIYGITRKQIAFELGYSIESVNALMQRFIDHHKLIRYNIETREIAIKNWGKYNFNKGGKPVLDCVKSELKNVKDISLIPYVSRSIQNEPIKNLYDTYYESFDVTLSNRKYSESKELKFSNNAPPYDTSTIRGQEEQEEQEQQEQQEEQEKEQQQQVGCQSVSRSSDFARIVEFTNQNITPVLPTIAEHLGYILEDFKDVDLILAALQNAVFNNARNKIKYAEGTLINWRQDMITNYQQLKTKENRENAKSQIGNNGQPFPRNYGRNETEIPRIFGDYVSPGI